MPPLPHMAPNLFLKLIPENARTLGYTKPWTQRRSELVLNVQPQDLNSYGPMTRMRISRGPKNQYYISYHQHPDHRAIFAYSKLTTPLVSPLLRGAMSHTVLVIGGMGSSQYKDDSWLRAHGEEIRKLYQYEEVQVWCPDGGKTGKREWAPYETAGADCILAQSPEQVWCDSPWLWWEVEKLNEAIVVGFPTGA